MRIALLCTVFNRYSYTKRFLDFYKGNIINHNHTFELYIVDDGSSEDEYKMLKLKKDEGIHWIEGTGSLFWNRGMRLAFTTMKNTKTSYDGYILVNNDTKLFEESLEEFFTLISHDNMIVGKLKESSDSKMSYGVRYNNHGEPLVNANFLWVGRDIIEDVGFLNARYLHAFGDYDFGLRVHRSGYHIRMTPFFIGSCDRNEVQRAFDNNLKFSERIRGLFIPNDFYIKDYYLYLKSNYSLLFTIRNIFLLTAKVIMPRSYNNFKS